MGAGREGDEYRAAIGGGAPAALGLLGPGMRGDDTRLFDSVRTKSAPASGEPLPWLPAAAVVRVNCYRAALHEVSAATPPVSHHHLDNAHHALALVV